METRKKQKARHQNSTLFAEIDSYIMKENNENLENNEEKLKYFAQSAHQNLIHIQFK